MPSTWRLSSVQANERHVSEGGTRRITYEAFASYISNAPELGALIRKRLVDRV